MKSMNRLWLSSPGYRPHLNLQRKRTRYARRSWRLAVLDGERLAERADSIGAELRRRLTYALQPYEMVCEVRGAGLMNGIVFDTPRQLKLQLPFEAFRAIHPGMFGQMLVRRLFHEHHILSQICGNNF